MASTQRIFVAADLPSTLKERLGEVRAAYPELGRELRWVRDNGIHITLKFLGDATPEQMAALREGLERLELPSAFTLACSGLGTFGRRARPRVLWAGLAGDLEALSGLQRQVEMMCVERGWPPETREFDPHVTLARFRDKFSVRDSLDDLLARYDEHLFLEFRVEQVTLYSSELGPGGAEYTPLYGRTLTTSCTKLDPGSGDSQTGMSAPPG